MDQIGKITHVFPKISVAVVELCGPLRVGDKIVIKGHSGSFEQTVDSMQIDRAPVEVAKATQSVGLKVANPMREGDLVYRAGETNK